jgi:hypothetical protein
VYSTLSLDEINRKTDWLLLPGHLRALSPPPPGGAQIQLTCSFFVLPPSDYLPINTFRLLNREMRIKRDEAKVERK